MSQPLFKIDEFNSVSSFGGVALLITIMNYLIGVDILQKKEGRSLGQLASHMPTYFPGSL